MKVICGLGNPGSEYDDTRHNVGWWAVDRLSVAWGLGSFRKEGRVALASGRVGEHAVRLLKPLTYMNRSGAALAPLRELEDFDAGRDLLVVVDDVALDVGRARLRASGSAGGHNGLKSVESILGTREYPRLRVGVGPAPAGSDLAEFVLSPFPPEDEDRIMEILSELPAAVRKWMDDGVEAAMTGFNR